MRPQHQGLIEPGRWPREPSSPDTVSPRRFARALRALCGPRKLRSAWAWRYARWIRRESARFGVDPFTIAALIYDHTRCDARARSDFGVGLAAINHEMHKRHVERRGRFYRYWTRGADGAWQPERLRLRYRFTRRWLRHPRASIHFAAALLRVASDQCPAIDGAFGSVPHRSPISHMVWGDRVNDAAYEDNVLWARRRLLAHYRGEGPPRCGDLDGVALRGPVDGAPVKAISGWGEDRAGGKRSHKGIDLFLPTGSPVYAVTDGVVSFAGVAVKPRRRRRRGRRGRRWRRGRRPRPRSFSLPPRRALRVSRRRLALAGRFVMLRHPSLARAQGSKAPLFYTAYMHLDRYVVSKGQRVKAGQLIGFVGNTGIKVSRPHLHFEIRQGGLRGHIDPLPSLRACLVAPEETYIGRYRRAKMGLDLRHDPSDDLPLIPTATIAEH